MIQSYLIISGSKKETDTFIDNLCDTYSIHPLDVTYAEHESTSFGIKEVRKLQKSLYLTPINSINKVVILPSSEQLTVQAQNALLKTLEEPPDNTIIILISPTKDIFLPTIQSRCTIIDLLSQPQELTETLSAEQIEKLLHESAGARLKRAQDLAKNKEEALMWLTKSIRSLHSELLTQVTKNNTVGMEQKIQLLTVLQKTHTILSTTSVNLRLQLENLFLSL